MFTAESLIVEFLRLAIRRCLTSPQLRSARAAVLDDEPTQKGTWPPGDRGRRGRCTHFDRAQVGHHKVGHPLYSGCVMPAEIAMGTAKGTSYSSRSVPSA